MAEGLRFVAKELPGGINTPPLSPRHAVVDRLHKTILARCYSMESATLVCAALNDYCAVKLR